MGDSWSWGAVDLSYFFTQPDFPKCESVLKLETGPWTMHQLGSIVPHTRLIHRGSVGYGMLRLIDV